MPLTCVSFRTNQSLISADGLHPNRVSSTEDPDVFRDYWNGRHGGNRWSLKPDQIRQTADW
jgi:hypothetical protein